jgi:NitT/TauT family transport system substrate-binding protein
MAKDHYHDRLLWRRVLCALMIVVLSGCQGGTSEMDQVAFRLDWTANGAHAPFFLGLDKGFYEEEGIELSILEGRGSGQTVQLIASGSEDFGFADAGTMLKGVAEGAQVTMVFGIFQRSPMCIISLGESEIVIPPDLSGHSIALTPGDSLSQIFPALLSANGVDADTVEIISTDPAGKITALLMGRADAMGGYSTNDLATIRATGQDVNVIMYADFGVNTLSNGIIVNNITLSERSDLVTRFLRATERSFEYAIEHPEKAVDSLLAKFPQLDRGVALEQLLATFELFHTPNTLGHSLGWQSSDDWNTTSLLLEEYAGVRGDVDVQQLYTNEFLP